MSRPRRIHWLAWQPTPYNDSLFRALAGDSSIDLEVHYRSRIVASHPWQSAMATGYRSRYYDTALGLDWCLLSFAFAHRDALFVVGGWDHPTSQVLLTLMRLFGNSYVLWTDTPDPTRMRGWYGRLRAMWLRWIFMGACRVMGTGTVAVEALQKMGAPAARVVNFPYWIDIGAYERASAHDNGACSRGAVQFVSSGRIDNRLKGHDVAVRAMALATEKNDVPWRYVIAGSGPDESKLKALIESLGLAHRISMLGWLEPEQLRNLYQSADVLIHPSPVHEPYGVAVLEAMAAELVVLASDCTCAALDRIEHGNNGLLHRAGDVAELAGQIRVLLRDRKAIVRLGARARATAERWPLDRAVTLIREISGACAES